MPEEWRDLEKDHVMSQPAGRIYLLSPGGDQAWFIHSSTFRRGDCGQLLCQVVGTQRRQGNPHVVPAAHYTKINAVIASKEKSRMFQENVH